MYHFEHPNTEKKLGLGGWGGGSLMYAKKSMFGTLNEQVVTATSHYFHPYSLFKLTENKFINSFIIAWVHSIFVCNY